MSLQQPLIIGSGLDAAAPAPDPAFESLQNKTYILTHKKDVFLFIPCYLAVVVKTLSNLDFKEGSVELDCTLIIRIDISKIPAFIVKKIRSKLEFRLSEKNITLEPGSTEGLTWKEDKGKMINLTYRFTPCIPFMADVRTAPFDQFFLDVRLELTSSYDVGGEDEEPGSVPEEFKNVTKYRFNIHLHPDKDKNLSFKEGFDRLPEYDIKVDESVAELKAEQKEGAKGAPPLYYYYPVVVYRVKMIRDPWHLIFCVFFPLTILQLLSLALFMQDPDVNSKLGNIGTVMLALLAYLPTVRADFPPVAYFTLCDVLVYSSVALNTLALLETVLRNFWSYEHLTFVCFGLALLVFLLNAGSLIKHCITHEIDRKKTTTQEIKQQKTSSSGFNQQEYENAKLHVPSFDTKEVKWKSL